MPNSNSKPELKRYKSILSFFHPSENVSLERRPSLAAAIRTKSSILAKRVSVMFKGKEDTSDIDETFATVSVITAGPSKESIELQQENSAAFTTWKRPSRVSKQSRLTDSGTFEISQTDLDHSRASTASTATSSKYKISHGTSAINGRCKFCETLPRRACSAGRFY